MATRSELLSLARSPAWNDRAEAGRQLAAFAGEAEVDGVLDRLLLDPANTAVTVGTAEALLARRDLVGLRVFARAYGRADDDNGNDFNDSMYSVRLSDEDNEGLVDRLRTLADSDADSEARAGAREVLRWLGSA